MFPGIIKGTPVSALQGIHVQLNQEIVKLHVRAIAGNPSYVYPRSTMWKWEKEVVCLTCAERTLKVTPDAVLLTGFGETLARDVTVGDVLKGIDNSFVVEKRDLFRVVSPMFNFVFEESYWLVVKGVFLGCATKHEKEVVNEYSQEVPSQCAKRFQETLQQD